MDGVTHPVQMGIEHGPAEQYPYVVSAFSRRTRHGRPGMLRQATRGIALRAPSSPQEGVMNAAHLHLLLNHVPVIGAIGILLLALVAWIRPSPDVLRTTLLFAAGNAAAALVVYLTADGAEDLVRRLPGVSRALIERHEDAALVATIAAAALGAAALAALLVYRTRTPPRWIARAMLLAAIIPVGLMGWTANLGGQIRHTEIRGATPGVAAGASTAPEEQPTDHTGR